MPSPSRIYDLVIIGGGISGLGAALAAADRGLKALLLEKELCGGATSANSLRIIHGGFRYLQSLDIARVRQSSRDQARLLETKRGLVTPLPCLMPLERWGVRSALPVWAAAQLFRVLRSPGHLLPEPRLLRCSELEPRCAAIESMAPHGVLCWQDALIISPGEFIHSLLKDVTTAGIEVRERARVMAVKDIGSEVRIKGTYNGFEFLESARGVIMATGPWIESLGEPEDTKPRGWCLGFNIVLRRALELTYAFGIRSREGRLFFVVPRSDGSNVVSVVGTGYCPLDGDPDNASVPEHVLTAFIKDLNQCMPHVSVSVQDISCVESGVLPMSRVKSEMPVLYGNAKLERKGRTVYLMSTKYTTFRSQGEEAVKLLDVG